MPRLIVVLAFVAVAIAALASSPNTGAMALRSSESMQHRRRGTAAAGNKPGKSKVPAAKNKHKAKHPTQPAHPAGKEKQKTKKAAGHKDKKDDRKKQPTPGPAPAPHSSPYIYGVDVCTAEPKEAFECFKNGAYTGSRSRTVPTQAVKGAGPNYTPAIVQMLKTKSMQKVGIRVPLLGNGDAIPTIQHAINAGFTGAALDLYYIDFRADTTKAAAAHPYTTLTQLTTAHTHVQPKELVDLLGAYIKPVAASVGTLWLDVETGFGYWGPDLAKNCEYVTKAVALIQADKVNFPMKLGIYTGQSTWGQYMGATCDFTPFRNLPLWYAAYGPTFDSFTAFHSMNNAWPTPYAHQWHGTTKWCGTSVDFNIYKSM